MRHSILIALLLLGASRAEAKYPVLGARALKHGGGIKIFLPAGQVRIFAWDTDSVVVYGKVAHGQRFYLSGTQNGLKLGIMEQMNDDSAPPCTLVVKIPRSALVSAKSPVGEIIGTDVSGWFYTVSGRIALDGSARSIQAMSISGDVEIAATSPIVRAQTGSGHVWLRGNPIDVDVSTIDGALAVQTSSILRGRFASVSGPITFAGPSNAGGVLDFTDHSGAVTLALPSDATGVFDLSTIAGAIENRLSVARPVSDNGSGLSLRVTVGERGTGSHVTVRTFRGGIVLQGARR